MRSYVNVVFPELSNNPARLYSATIYQKKYEHEVAVLKFRDWGVEYDSVASGALVSIHIGAQGSERLLHGYVHHVKVNRTPGTFFTEVTVVGASFTMKQQTQAVYRNLTADAVIKQIGQKHGFVVKATPHPRVYPQITQAGHTDWEMCVRLAKQCGYTLRTENTELYFEPILKEFTETRSQAPRFVMRHESSHEGSTIYSFTPMIGESLPFEDAFKSAVAIAGVDKNSSSVMSVTQQTRNKKTRKKTTPEFFDRFATDIVAMDPETAQHETEAAEHRNTFPYRATVEVLGDPTLHPNMPVYLDGLGTDYTGHWIILGTEHKVVESGKNVQVFTTILHVGIDSLGEADRWTDNNVVNVPAGKRSRVIQPNVFQSNVKPQTKLLTTHKKIGPQQSAPFGNIKNRAMPTVNGVQATGSKWKTNTASLDNIIYHSDQTPAVVKDRYRKAVSRG
jgi:phage protein D